MSSQLQRFLRPWFSKNRRQNLETGAAEKPIHDIHEHNNSFRHNSIHCRRRHRWYNYKRSTTTKTKVFAREKFSQIFTDVFTITKFLRPWFSKNRRQNLETGATEKLLPSHDFHEHNNYSFRHNYIHWRRRHRCYNYKHRTTTKTKVFAREKFSQIFTDVITITGHHKTFPFFQNAASQFLMNTIIRSILTLFTNCKHRHHSNFRTTAILKVIMDLQWTNSASWCRTIKSHWSLSDCVSRSQIDQMPRSQKYSPNSDWNPQPNLHWNYLLFL